MGPGTGQFVLKRVPETGSQHAPACPSFEPEAQQSGLGELLGDAVIEREPGKVELRVDFPWARTTGRCVARNEPQEAGANCGWLPFTASSRLRCFPQPVVGSQARRCVRQLDRQPWPEPDKPPHHLSS